MSTRPVSSSPACPVIGLSVIPHPLLMVVLLATQEVSRGTWGREEVCGGDRGMFEKRRRLGKGMTKDENNGWQGRIQDFSQGRAASDELVLGCY